MTARSEPVSHSPAFPTLPLVVGLLWLAAAIVAGITGRLASVPSPGPQLLILALSAAVVVAATRRGSLRAWVERADLRALVAPHLVRFVGFVFLAFAARGELSPEFARNAGIGDIVVAALAIALIASGLPRTAWQRRAWLAWSVLGLLDFALVFATAARVAMRDSASLASLFQLPLAVIPTFAVPLLIASHVIVIRRLLAAGREAPAA